MIAGNRDRFSRHWILIEVELGHIQRHRSSIIRLRFEILKQSVKFREPRIERRGFTYIQQQQIARPLKAQKCSQIRTA